MKVFIFCIIAFLCSTQIHAQFPLYSDNPVWYVEDHQNKILEKITYEKDTFMCGHNYSKLNKMDYTIGDRNYILKGYVRNESGKVFFRYSGNCEDKEYLMYDFSLSPGDTVYCGYNLIESENPYPGYVDTTKFWVESIDSVTYFERKYKRLNMKFIPFPNYPSTPKDMVWAEILGFYHGHPFYPFFFWESKSTWFDLSCMELTGELIFKYEETSLNCDSLTFSPVIGSDSFSAENIVVFPNPSRSELTVQINGSYREIQKITLVNTQGQIIKTFTPLQENQIKINVTKLNGLYFLQFVINGKMITKKVILN